MKALFAVARRACVGALAAFACNCAFAAGAVDPERLAEARALLDVLQFERQIDAMSASMAGAMARQFGQGGAANPRVAQINMEEAMSAMKEQARAPGGLVDSMAEAYASQFTIDELRQIREFYLSPAGKRMLQASPEIMKQVFPQMMKSSRALAPRVCAKVKARLIAEKNAAGDTMTCPAAP
jgi:hypothetical protein